MKKLLAVLMVLAFAVAAAPAMADDTLDASGSMRVEAYSQGSVNFLKEDTPYGEGDSVNGGDENFWDQRFRLQLKFQPADGVKAVMRTDITEGTWGDWANRPDAGTNGQIMIDRAYLSVDKGMLNITAGLSAYNLGMGHAYNNQGQGIQFTAKLDPVTLTAGMSKESENGDLEDEDDNTSEDKDNYWLNVGFATDMVKGNVFYAWANEANDDKNTPNLIGVNASAKIGPVNVAGEIDLFGGEYSDDVDVTGTQFYGDVNMMFSDQLKIGADLVYSSSNDDGDEYKLTALNKFGDYVYQDKHALSPGSFQGQVLGATGDIFDLVPDSWVPVIAQLADVTEDQAAGYSSGALGFGPYVEFVAMEGLTLKANFFYINADDDEIVENAMIYGLGATWAFAPNTKLEVAYHVVSLSLAGDVEDALDDEGIDYDDTFTGLGAVLTVSF